MSHPKRDTYFKCLDFDDDALCLYCNQNTVEWEWWMDKYSNTYYLVWLCNCCGDRSPASVVDKMSDIDF